MTFPAAAVAVPTAGEDRLAVAEDAPGEWEAQDFDPASLLYVRGPAHWTDALDIRIYLNDRPDVAETDLAMGEFYLSAGDEPRATPVAFQGTFVETEGERAGEQYYSWGFASEAEARAALPSPIDYPRALTWFEGDVLRDAIGVDHYAVAASLDSAQWAPGELLPVIHEDGTLRLRFYETFAASMDLHVLPADYEVHGPDISEWRTFPTYALTRTAKNYYEVVLPAEHQGAQFQVTFQDAQPYQPVWRTLPLWPEDAQTHFPCADGTGLCLPSADQGPDTPGPVDTPVTGSRAILTTNNDVARVTQYEIPAGAEVITGDFDGDGYDTVAWRIGNKFTFPGLDGGDDLTVWYGMPGELVLVGDWDSDGVDTLAIHRGSVVHVRNDLAGGDATNVYSFGLPGEHLLAGDWDGDGRDTLAVVRGDTVLAADTMRDDRIVHTFPVGSATDHLVVGDLDGDGRDAVVAFRDGVFVTDPAAEVSPVILLGASGDRPLVGHWKGSTMDSVGIHRP